MTFQNNNKPDPRHNTDGLTHTHLKSLTRAFKKPDPKEKAQKRSKNTNKFLYMTFDDGPNFGTHVVLDAFKAAGGKRTFFINCLRICTCETNLPAEYYEKGN